MKLIKVNNLKSKVLPKHERVYAKEIWGKESGAKNCVVLYNEGLCKRNLGKRKWG